MNTALKNPIHLSMGAYRLLPLRYEDIFKIQDWRNAQMDYLRQKKKLTHQDQADYYTQVIEPSRLEAYPRIHLFSYLQEDVCVGYGGLVNISWEDKRAEVSFLMDPQVATNLNRYSTAFTAFLTLIKQWAREGLALRRLYTETFDLRPKHIEVLERNGFEREGVLREHVKVGDRYVNSIFHGCILK